MIRPTPEYVAATTAFVRWMVTDLWREYLYVILVCLAIALGYQILT